MSRKSQALEKRFQPKPDKFPKPKKVELACITESDIEKWVNNNSNWGYWERKKIAPHKEELLGKLWKKTLDQYKPGTLLGYEKIKEDMKYQLMLERCPLAKVLE